MLGRLRLLFAADPATNAARRLLGEASADPARAAGLLDRIKGHVPAKGGVEKADATNTAPPEADRDERGMAELREALLGNSGVLALPKDPRSSYPPAAREELARLEAARDALAAAAPRAAVALAVDEDKPVNLPVHLRGNHLSPTKDPVPRGFLQVINRVHAPPEIPADRSGRLELARWMTDSQHPLTARVIVNRLWQAHFGQGLVRTPDNFGLRGEPPTHPELLDWLAREFIRSGWDVKAMHRLLLNSAVYQQSSASLSSGGAEAEGLLPRFPRQRLEAEMVRDSILAVSGRLDARMGGSLVAWKNNEYVPGDAVSAQSVPIHR